LSTDSIQDTEGEIKWDCGHLKGDAPSGFRITGGVKYPLNDLLAGIGGRMCFAGKDNLNGLPSVIEKFFQVIPAKISTSIHLSIFNEAERLNLSIPFPMLSPALSTALTFFTGIWVLFV
jgi:hypothetical protein